MDPLTVGLTLAAKYAPDVIKYFSGSDKASNVAAAVIDVAQTVTGTGGVDADAILAADPAKAMEFRTALMAAEVDLAKAQLADIGSARHMQEIALGQDDVFSKRFVYYFAAAWSLFTMIYSAGITWYPPVSEGGKTNSATILGFLLGTAVASIFAYLFGSTRGSDMKNKLLALKQ